MTMIFKMLVTVQVSDVRPINLRVKALRKFNVHISRADSVLAYVVNLHVEFVRQVEFVEFTAQIFFRHA